MPILSGSSIGNNSLNYGSQGLESNWELVDFSNGKILNNSSGCLQYLSFSFSFPTPYLAISIWCFLFLLFLRARDLLLRTYIYFLIHTSHCIWMIFSFPTNACLRSVLSYFVYANLQCLLIRSSKRFLFKLHCSFNLILPLFLILYTIVSSLGINIGNLQILKEFFNKAHGTSVFYRMLIKNYCIK